jgi:hypothetical protein
VRTTKLSRGHDKVSRGHDLESRAQEINKKHICHLCATVYQAYREKLVTCRNVVLLIFFENRET